MATHSNNLAWKIPWMEEPSRLQSMGLQRVGHDWATSLSLFTFTFHFQREYSGILKYSGHKEYCASILTTCDLSSINKNSLGSLRAPAPIWIHCHLNFLRHLAISVPFLYNLVPRFGNQSSFLCFDLHNGSKGSASITG